VLLDEPMAGMDRKNRKHDALLERIRARITVLLVEHDMDAVFRLADRVSVLVSGRVIASGAPAAIRAIPKSGKPISARMPRHERAAAGGKSRNRVRREPGAVRPRPCDPRRRVATLLGRNGMGKTTTVRSIMGLTPARSGVIRFRGERIEGSAPTASRAAASRWFRKDARSSQPQRAGEPGRVRGKPQRDARPVDACQGAGILPALAERMGNLGSRLSGGEQQMLAIGRALMTNPHLLILDEATEGLAPLVREEIWSASPR